MNFGDVIDVDFGTPLGSEAGFLRPAIVCTADTFLRFRPTTVIVAPITSNRRTFPSHIEDEPDRQNAVVQISYILVEQLRAISHDRCSPTSGNVGAVVSHRITDIIAMIVGIA